MATGRTHTIARRLAEILGFDGVTVTASAKTLAGDEYIITSGTGEGPGVFAYLGSDVERFLDRMEAEGRESADYSADFCGRVAPVESIEVAWALAAQGQCLLRAGICGPLLVGQRCRAEDPAGIDSEDGVIFSIAGGTAIVGWDQGISTPIDLDHLEAI